MPRAGASANCRSLRTSCCDVFPEATFFLHDLFLDDLPAAPSREPLEDGAVLLRGFASSEASALVEAVDRISKQAPFRHLVTPGGYTMSVAMTNCGRVGWVSDRTGYYCYDPVDPDMQQRTGPRCLQRFLISLSRAAAEAGFPNYDPDACLINSLQQKLGLHQDRDEKDAWAPIVSVSLGSARAVYSCGGAAYRSDPVRRLLVESGDIAVWGGPARFIYHGVAPLKDGEHPLTGCRSPQSYIPKSALMSLPSRRAEIVPSH